ncbi:MAG TPA: glycosyltransferase family 4 protein [Vicinamibacterales bacterium]|nr:glycosyltransferase family 4 protein [Vicinamibacterales bacterium]
MKLAMVVPGGLHPSGEVQVVPSWLALFEALSRSHDVHAFALRHLHTPQTYQLRGFTVHDLGRPSGLPGMTRRAQDRALAAAFEATGPFDLIHGFHADPAGQLAARAAHRLGVPSVVTCDSGEFVSLPAIDYGSQRTSTGRQAVNEACALATRVHVCTQFMSNLARARNIQATVIPLTSVTPAAVKARSPRLQDGYRLVQVATLSRVKNQRLLLDAFRIVRESVDARLDLIGDDMLGGALQRHAARVGIAEHVTFHGFLPQSRVHDILSASDLYVQSSLHEAAGVAVLEAAAHGVPAVGTMAGYVADWAPVQALAIRDATPGSLAAAIVLLCVDTGRRQSIAGLARSFSLAHDVEWSAAQFDRLYRSLV